MKRIYALFLAVFGVSGSSYADCYEELKSQSSCSEDGSESYYEVCRDLALLESLTEEYEATENEDEKEIIKEEARVVLARIKEKDCLGALRAALVCAICTDPK